MTATYNADIENLDGGQWRITLREHPDLKMWHVIPVKGKRLGEIISSSPESALIRAMRDAGLPNGSLQTWRGEMPCLFYEEVYQAPKKVPA